MIINNDPNKNHNPRCCVKPGSTAIRTDSPSMESMIGCVDVSASFCAVSGIDVGASTGISPIDSDILDE